jgi:hypothetical protein
MECSSHARFVELLMLDVKLKWPAVPVHLLHLPYYTKALGLSPATTTGIEG